MKSSKRLFTALTALFFAIALAFSDVFLAPGMSSASATTYTCTAGNCGDFYPTTDSQFNQKPTKGTDDPTVREALSGSINTSITNGYNNTSGTDLGIKKFWHTGGKLPYDDSFEHVTVEVYKYNEYVKTCHVYQFQIDTKAGKRYQTSCV